MVNESTQTLLLYYITTDPLCFTQTDMSILMVTIGLTGMLIQVRSREERGDEH